MHVFTLGLLLLGLVFQSVAKETILQLVNKIPGCADTCFHKAVAMQCPEFTDFQCQCTKPHVLFTDSFLVQCLPKYCGPAHKTDDIRNLYSKICSISRARTSGREHHGGSGSSSPDNDSSGGGGGGLSTGASAGIGVGVAVFVLAIFGVIIWMFLRRRRRQRKPAQDEKAPDSEIVKAELPAENTTKSIPQSPAYAHEVDGIESSHDPASFKGSSPTTILNHGPSEPVELPGVMSNRASMLGVHELGSEK